jgi:hypothetical protein
LTQQATGDNAIWSFNAPGTLNVQRDITNRTTFDCAQCAELECSLVGSTSRSNQWESDDLLQSCGHLQMS